MVSPNASKTKAMALRHKAERKKALEEVSKKAKEAKGNQDLGPALASLLKGMSK